jgi:hypothetical protein
VPGEADNPDGEFCPWTPTPRQTPTPAERQAFKASIEFAIQAKYPIRRNKELTPEQLSILRATQLGDGAPFATRRAASAPKPPIRDRRPLTPEELRAARREQLGDRMFDDDGPLR